MSKIIEVKPLKGFKIKAAFEDGVVKVFDALPFLDNASLSRLRDEEYFKGVEVGSHGDRVTWQEGEEFGADMLYVRGVVI
ncbi:MAG: DUF2442 domain-containing protein [Campylobacterales bacterium]|nr:DUF2442 domain-containing protein [Campylobacterales bacterium]